MYRVTGVDVEWTMWSEIEGCLLVWMDLWDHCGCLEWAWWSGGGWYWWCFDGWGGNVDMETYLMIRRMNKDVGAKMSWCQSTTKWQLLAMSRHRVWEVAGVVGWIMGPLVSRGGCVGGVVRDVGVRLLVIRVRVVRRRNGVWNSWVLGTLSSKCEVSSLV